MAENVTFEDFKKLDIRIGQVKSVEKVPDTDKLLKIIFDIGNGEERHIMAGMAEFFNDSQVLIGKQLPLLLNIEPRNFRGHTSHGMIIAADFEHKPIFLEPEKSIPNGSIVK